MFGVSSRSSSGGAFADLSVDQRTTGSQLSTVSPFILFLRVSCLTRSS